MSLPYKTGLSPVNLGKGAAYTASQEVLQTSVANGAMFTGDIVLLTANGKAIPAAAGATVSAGSTNVPYGVAVGFAWIDPVSKQPKESKFLPANTSSAPGIYEGINFRTDAGAMVRVITDPDQVYAIKALASVAQAKLGDRLEYVRGTGSTLTGRSGARASVAGIATDILKCVGVLRTTEFGSRVSNASTVRAGNDWNSAQTVLLVKVVQQ